MSVITGVVSWMDYRREEVRIMGDAVKPGYRIPPKLSNFWRWHEPYLLALIVATVLVVVWFTMERILPLIH